MLYIHVRTCIYYEWKIMYCISKLTFASYTLQLNGSHWLCFSRIFSYSVTWNVQNKIIRIFQAGCFRKTELGGVYMFYFFFWNSSAQHYVCQRLRTYVVTHEGVWSVFSLRNATLWRAIPRLLSVVYTRNRTVVLLMYPVGTR